MSKFVAEKHKRKVLTNLEETHKTLGILQTKTFIDLERLRKRLSKVAQENKEPLQRGVVYNQWKKRPNTVGVTLHDYFTKLKESNDSAHCKKPVVNTYAIACDVPRTTFDNLIISVKELSSKSTKQFPWKDSVFKHFVTSYIERSLDTPKKNRGKMFTCTHFHLSRLCLYN